MHHADKDAVRPADSDATQWSRRRLFYSAILASLPCTATAAILGSTPISTEMQRAVALADRWSRALEAGDYDGVAACYAPEFVIWNNIRRTDITGAQHLVALKTGLFAHYSHRKYIDARLHTIAGGFVRQHRLTGLMDGAPIDMPICIVCQMRGDRLTRVDEYLTLPAPPPLA